MLKEKTINESYRKQEKTETIGYTILVEKFNKKYSSLVNHKKLLKEYINNISNTNSLKEFIESETVKVTKKLQSMLPSVSDKVTKSK